MPAKYPHVVKAEAYARDVIDGKIPACKWVLAACKRHFADKQKSAGKTYKYRFDRAKAERICDFAERLPHVKGKWAQHSEKIKLEPWQCFGLAVPFGWVHKSTGLRRFRRVFKLVPRKNAKSTEAALVGNYMLVADGEAGAEVYAGATTQEQAFEVFRPAKQMIDKSPEFQARFGVLAGARSIIQLQTNSFFKPLIGKPGDGASPHCAITDEYHEHPDDEQVDTMRTGMGARQQPMQFIISTAGDNISGPCFMMQEDCKKVLDGLVEDDELFAIIYTIDDDDDWTSETALRKANPNYGVSVDADYLIAQQNNAIQTPRKQSVFKTKHLNVWVGAMDAFFDIQKYKACGDSTLKIESLYGRKARFAIDLASKIDLTAFDIEIDMEDGFVASFTKYYMPEATLNMPGRDHFRAWAKEGWITITDGEIIDFDIIEGDILTYSSFFEAAEVAYDPWQATQMANNLTKNGAKPIEYRMTVQNMSEPMKNLDAMIRSGKYLHDGNPVSVWCMSNVVAKIDAKDNVYPRKSRDESKIDGAIAKIMNRGRAILQPPAEIKDYKIYFV